MSLPAALVFSLALGESLSAARVLSLRSKR